MYIWNQMMVTDSKLENGYWCREASTLVGVVLELWMHEAIINIVSHSTSVKTGKDRKIRENLFYILYNNMYLREQIWNY